jgi:hypothetical protein
MKILVTGGAGFIGSHIAEALIRDGHSVTVLDNLYCGKKEFVPAEAEFVEGDIRFLRLITSTPSTTKRPRRRCRSRWNRPALMPTKIFSASFTSSNAPARQACENSSSRRQPRFMAATPDCPFRKRKYRRRTVFTASANGQVNNISASSKSCTA